jgi:mono/diheme cytochrome c family protein
MAYLRAVNRSGRSLLPPLGSRVAVDPWKHFGLITAEWVRDSGHALDESVVAGEAVWLRNQCGACHVPFAEGRHQSPDLSQRALDRSVPVMQELLDNGRGWMPAYMLGRVDVESLHAYLEWITSRRAELVELNDRMLERENFAWTAVPWFQYE